MKMKMMMLMLRIALYPIRGLMTVTKMLLMTTDRMADLASVMRGHRLTITRRTFMFHRNVALAVPDP